MTRTEQLTELGFKKNEDHHGWHCDLKYTAGDIWIDTWDVVEYKEDEWYRLIEEVKEDISADKKKTAYKNALYSYGITALLLVMQEYEQKQMFEECQWILLVIRDVNEFMQPNEELLESRYSEETIPKLKQEFNKLGLSGDTAVGNMEYYVEQVKRIYELQR